MPKQNKIMHRYNNAIEIGEKRGEEFILFLRALARASMHRGIALKIACSNCKITQNCLESKVRKNVYTFDSFENVYIFLEADTRIFNFAWKRLIRSIVWCSVYSFTLCSLHFYSSIISWCLASYTCVYWHDGAFAEQIIHKWRNTYSVKNKQNINALKRSVSLTVQNLYYCFGYILRRTSAQHIQYTKCTMGMPMRRHFVWTLNVWPVYFSIVFNSWLLLSNM